MGNFPKNLPKENMYLCENVFCRKVMVTVDVAPGVTPESIECIHCPNKMNSGLYPLDRRPAGSPDPTHEWYAPEEGDKQYCPSDAKLGVLALRERTEAEGLFHVEDEIIQHCGPKLSMN